MDMNRETLIKIYTTMATIRHFEERGIPETGQRRMSGSLHSSAGQEAVPTGICANLTDEDYIGSTHRGHGHCIAKGVDVKAMMAELYGRATGACKGKGGSMHIADLDRGMLGANGIVGAGIPLACGAALSAQVLGTENVAVSFFGDGGANEGSFHEGLNLAGVWQLPAIFVAENNGWAESTSSDYSVAGADIAGRARSYGIRGVAVDGLDLFDVYEKAGKAIAAARAGEGPTLLECKTYRFYGHHEGDKQGYRSQEEVEEYRKNHCVIKNFRARTTEEQVLANEELDRIEAQVAETIESAVAYAADSPWPEPADVTEDVYVNYKEVL
jgi:pyruvate dehydrogenase E1 component alpha subunit